MLCGDCSDEMAEKQRNGKSHVCDVRVCNSFHFYDQAFKRQLSGTLAHAIGVCCMATGPHLSRRKLCHEQTARRERNIHILVQKK